MSKRKVRRAIPALIVSHWFKLINDLKASPLEFYRRLQQVLGERQVPKLDNARIEWHEGGPFSPKRQYLRFLRERTVFDVCASPFGTGFFVSWRLGELPLRLNFLGLLIMLCIVVGTGAWAEDHYHLRFYFLVYPERFYWAAGITMGVLILLLGLMRSAVGNGLADLDALLLHTPVVAGFYERFLRPITYYRIDLALMYEQAVHNAVMQVVDELTDSQKLPRLSADERKPILRDFYKR